ncbi:MAG: Re/Si-specific NAD(P)(+) transhydrogenase subunit alpha [Candidatus Hydrogenedentota bacterium]
MRLFVPKEYHPGETRVPIIPETVRNLVKKGAECVVEQGLGELAGHADGAYEEAGAAVTTDRASALGEADLVLRLRKPPAEEIPQMKRGAIHISFLDPFNEPELVDAFVEQGISAISMEMIPRTTLAQKMDALSSQANLAGYVAVILAAEQSDKIFPMMMTPAGTIAPSRVFVIGAGVAGLQAIATARRLGARVEAFDTRPAVEGEVASLGAKFIKADLGETGQTEQGYAKELTPEQQEKQRQAMAKVCAHSDVVITTAQLFGKKAPVIITDAILQDMKPGAVVVDLAVETGGNVEGSRLGEEAVIHGVRVLGYGNLPGRVPVHASQMYSANLANLIGSYWDDENKRFVLDREDEIIQGCLITHEGELVNERIRQVRETAGTG